MEKTFIFAGFGGQGMLLIGKFVAMACMLDGKHVSWLPSYGPEMRGGTANCSVIVSDDPVASPLVDKADVIVAMNRPSLDKFEEHVKPGGVLVINSSIIDRKAVRDDITVVYCDANGIAESIGNPKGANVAILGAVLAVAPVTTVESMMEAIRIELGEKKARFLEGNKKALLAGTPRHRQKGPSARMGLFCHSSTCRLLQGNQAENLFHIPKLIVDFLPNVWYDCDVAGGDANEFFFLFRGAAYQKIPEEPRLYH